MPECWLCAMTDDEMDMCVPVPGFGGERDAVWCPECRAAAAVESLKGDEEMRRGRERNDRKRVEEAMRREREINDRKRVQKDRARKEICR